MAAAPSPRFTPLSLLGRGGMGEVYLARMEGDSPQLVAVKRIGLERKKDPETLRRFEREARICALLDHPHIVRLLDFGQDEVGPYLALEYVSGGTAAALLKGTRAAHEQLPLPAALSIARDVAEALAYAHQLSFDEEGSRGLVHHDVSPENILLGKDGRAKLADFGLARMNGASTLTRTGTLKGKLRYLAPELFEGVVADEKADVFAFGATLFHLLTGVPPFAGETEAELVRSILYGKPLELRMLRQDVPAAIVEWTQAALHRQSDQRPTVAPLLAALHQALPEPEDAYAAVGELVQRHCPEEAPPAAPSGASLVGRAWTRSVVQSVASPRGRFAVAGIAAVLLLATVLWFRRPAESPGTLVMRMHRPPPSTQSAAPPSDEQPAPRAPTPDAVAIAPSAAEGRAAAEANGEGSGPRAPPSAESGANRSRATVSKKSVTRAPQTARRRPAAQDRTGGPALLALKVFPWARVFIDGKDLGLTPLEPVELSPGAHNLILVNPTLGAREAHRIEVKPGRTTSLKYQLSAP